MAKLFILIKRKGSKQYLGAIPAKKGVTMARLKAILKRSLKRGFIAKIVTSNVVNTLVKRGFRKAVGSMKRRVGSMKRRIGTRRRVKSNKRISKKARMARLRNLRKARLARRSRR